MAAGVVPLLQALVKQAGSDLHLAAGSVPMIRVKGELSKVNMPALTPQDIEKLVGEITSTEQKKDLRDNKYLDFAVKVTGLSIFRVNVFYQRHGLSAVFRALREHPPQLEDMSLPEVCRKVCFYPQGLVLVTGPTGSGKSTTLAAIIDYINRNQRKHILTLEDPIEFQHITQRCMMNQRQLGSHFTSFASALKAALREDPDVILVGEMRDPETIGLAITAAETGHLVFATLHTNSAPKTIDRIIDSFPGDQQSQIRTMLADSLKVVMTQKLVPNADGQGRHLVMDILINNSAVSSLIREGKLHQISSMMQMGRKEGMQVLEQELMEAVRTGKVNGRDAWEHANDKRPFVQWAPQEALQTSVATAAVGPSGHKKAG